ncbi:MAG: alpha/beta fold hydrolase [Saprospiraceae bacterium]|nr:alpha/beta fold hydrolase [Saprospiraceae bacterium]
MATNIPESTLKKIRRVGKGLNALAAVSPALAGRIAFTFFCTPKPLPVRETDRNFLATAKHDQFSSEGKMIRTYHWSNNNPQAPTLLFLHGWESNAARWHKYVKAALAAGFSVSAFDAPASGHSGGKLLNAWLYSKALQKFLSRHGTPYGIVGHSLGGAAAVFGLTMFDTIKPEKVVLLASFAESTRVIRDFAGILGANENVVQAIFRHIEKRSGIPIEAFSVRQKAGLLTNVSGLVMHDREDEVAPVEEGREIARSWSCAYQETSGLGHRMQDRQVVQAVLDFLKTP